MFRKKNWSGNAVFTVSVKCTLVYTVTTPKKKLNINSNSNVFKSKNLSDKLWGHGKSNVLVKLSFTCITVNCKIVMIINTRRGNSAPSPLGATARLLHPHCKVCNKLVYRSKYLAINVGEPCYKKANRITLFLLW